MLVYSYLVGSRRATAEGTVPRPQSAEPLTLTRHHHTQEAP